MKPRIIVLGGNFAGLHAAFELHHTLGDNAVVTVIAPEDNFVFLPSLIWVVTGMCPPKRIQFDLRMALEPRGINFVHHKAHHVDLDKNQVITEMCKFDYDYLVIATGADPNWDAVPGLGPYNGYTEYVCSVPWATNARRQWRRLLENPGPVVVGCTQATGCYGLAYEMALNLEYSLRKSGKHSIVPMTFITSEPFLGHLGMGGVGNLREKLEKLFSEHNIKWITNVATKEIIPNEIHLADGQVVPFDYSIYMTPFKGRQYVFDSPGLGNKNGFIPVNDRYQHVNYPNVYAAGVAVAADQPEKTDVPVGVPKTGYMSDIMGKVAAQNIEAEIMNKSPKELPFGNIDLLCVMDGGDKAVSIVADRIFEPRKRKMVNVTGVGHMGKIMFEKYYMWKVRNGLVYLP